MVITDYQLLIISTTSGGVLNFIGFLISFNYARKRNNRLLYLFSANWFFQAVVLFLDALAHFNYSPLMMGIAMIPYCIGIPCLFIFIDLVRKEHVNTITFTILIITLFFLIFFSFYPGGMIVIPDYGVNSIGLLRVIQIVWLGYYVLFYFNWIFQTWRKAPRELKRITTYLLLGSILFSLVTAVMYTLGAFIRTFNPIGFIMHSIGAIITVIVLWKEPKIIYILPFKAYRILVLDTGAGIALFKHDWAKLKNIEENIFSMVLQAVGNVLNEVLKKGEIREIQLERAVLLIQHDEKFPIASIIIASKSSKALKFSLKIFHEKFISRFKNDLKNLHDVSKFVEANNIVNDIFDFVPIYLKN
ncbi:MAG: hypothetical protein ACFFKA_18720 [Candidatus Thorarchaeota archaeon]